MRCSHPWLGGREQGRVWSGALASPRLQGCPSPRIFTWAPPAAADCSQLPQSPAAVPQQLPRPLAGAPLPAERPPVPELPLAAARPGKWLQHLAHLLPPAAPKPERQHRSRASGLPPAAARPARPLRSLAPQPQLQARPAVPPPARPPPAAASARQWQPPASARCEQRLPRCTAPAARLPSPAPPLCVARRAPRLQRGSKEQQGRHAARCLGLPETPRGSCGSSQRMHAASCGRHAPRHAWALSMSQQQVPSQHQAQLRGSRARG